MLSAVATQLNPANVTMVYPASNAGGALFLKWQPEAEYRKSHNIKIIAIWSSVFALCWLPFVLIVALYFDA